MAMKSFFLLFRRFSPLIVLFSIVLFAGQLYAAIVLKVISINPSKTKTQKAAIKSYLPKEIKPEDVINKGELEIAYDNQQGCYFVFGEVELKPGESLVQDVEIKDIWLIPFSELEVLKAEMAKIAGMLKNTDYADRIAFLKESVDSKIDQIAAGQKNPALSPDRHISDYRDSLKVMESVKSDLLLARSFLAQHSPLSSAMVWKLILGIVIFLGILGASFYFIWQQQIKNIGQEEPFAMPKEDVGGPDKNPKQHEAKTEEKLDSGNIDKMLGKEDHKE